MRLRECETAGDGGVLARIAASHRAYREIPGEGRVDVLDGFRTLFVLIICWYHIWQQSWLTPVILGTNLDFLVRSGYEWVDAMLLLSGFLLFLPCADGKKLDVKRFYLKRAARIVPSYYLCVLILLVFTVFPQGGYTNAWEAVRDILAHLTFTHSLFPFSYTGSPINGVLWTLSVEVQFYLLFPLLCLAFRKKPLLTWLGMTAAAFAYRALVGTLPDTTLYINQLPAFFDVYANGFMAALVYRTLRERMQRETTAEKAFFTALFAVCVGVLVGLMRAQASEVGYENIHHGQMDRRFVLSCVLSIAMVSAAFSLPFLRFLLGNRLMRFFSLVSFQYYMYHQAFSLQLKQWRFPSSTSLPPNFDSEQPWQTRYTLCCFIGALLIAALLTFLFERPVSRLLTGKKKKTANAE